MKTLLFLAAIHILCAGSTNTKATRAKNSDPTMHAVKSVADTISLNGQWFLQPMIAADTAAGKTPILNLQVSSGTFTGNTGCNTMRGRFQKTDSSLVFNENIATSRMFCSGYDEAAFLRSLLRTNRFRFENDVLVLMFDATELSRWARKPAKMQMKKA